MWRFKCSTKFDLEISTLPALVVFFIKHSFFKSICTVVNHTQNYSNILSALECTKFSVRSIVFNFYEKKNYEKETH